MVCVDMGPGIWGHYVWLLLPLAVCRRQANNQNEVGLKIRGPESIIWDSDMPFVCCQVQQVVIHLAGARERLGNRVWNPSTPEGWLPWSFWRARRFLGAHPGRHEVDMSSNDTSPLDAYF